MEMLENYRSISACSQSAAALIGVFRQQRSPLCQNTIARWEDSFIHFDCVDGGGVYLMQIKAMLQKRARHSFNNYKMLDQGFQSQGFHP